MRQISKASTSLLIFDYIDHGNYSQDAIMEGALPFLPHPIKSNDLRKNLKNAGWALISMTDISKEYERWYSRFMNKVESKREEILETGGNDAMDTVSRLYGELLERIQRGVLVAP